MKKSGAIEITCPICHNYKSNRLAEHIRKDHGETAFHQAILDFKKSGMPDSQIGEVFGITFRQLEKIITNAYGVNISDLTKPRKIKYWVPKNYKDETTTVWSYKQRGEWATHNGRYRGNWSPYIPRNLILKYSKPGEIVLDFFLGSGTTAVEAKLLGRRCIGKDINPACIALAKENLNFKPPKTLFGDQTIFEPQVYVGDARDLSEIPDNSIDLICAHPPYAGIISYSSKIEGDLSQLSSEEFLDEMRKVAKESYRVLKPGRKCAILIGDTRKRKHVVPIGFQTIRVFLDVGFKLKELVIKRQHNCKTTGFWREKSIKNNFLLLAYEYLPIFEKPNIEVDNSSYDPVSSEILSAKQIEPVISKDYELETTCVWIFPSNNYEKYLDSNVVRRYARGNNYQVLSIDIEKSKSRQVVPVITGSKDLLFIKSPLLEKPLTAKTINSYLHFLTDLVDKNLNTLPHGGFIVIHTRDVRVNEYVEPIGEKIMEILSFDNLWLKEIVVVTRDKTREPRKVNVVNEGLEITHEYLLIYEVVK